MQKATTTKRHKSAQKENPVLQLLMPMPTSTSLLCADCVCCCCYVFRVFSHCVAFLICFPLFHGNSNKFCTNCCLCELQVWIKLSMNQTTKQNIERRREKNNNGSGSGRGSSSSCLTSAALYRCQRQAAQCEFQFFFYFFSISVIHKAIAAAAAASAICIKKASNIYEYKKWNQ